MEKPKNSVVQWSTADVDNEGNQIKVEPPAELQSTGLLKNQPMGRQWFNYVLNNLCEYVSYLADAVQPSSSGTGVVIVSTKERTDLTAQGWKLIKQESVSGSSTGYINYYEK